MIICSQLYFKGFAEHAIMSDFIYCERNKVMAIYKCDGCTCIKDITTTSHSNTETRSEKLIKENKAIQLIINRAKALRLDD